jgi:hypothetical protein
LLFECGSTIYLRLQGATVLAFYCVVEIEAYFDSLRLLTMLMLSRSSILALLAVYGSSVAAFTAPTFGRPTLVHLHESAVTDSPSAQSEDSISADEIVIPTKLPSDCGFDYVPLATMLATGELKEADQVRSFRRTNGERAC